MLSMRCTSAGTVRPSPDSEERAVRHRQLVQLASKVGRRRNTRWVLGRAASLLLGAAPLLWWVSAGLSSTVILSAAWGGRCLPSGSPRDSSSVQSVGGVRRVPAAGRIKAPLGTAGTSSAWNATTAPSGARLGAHGLPVGRGDLRAPTCYDGVRTHHPAPRLPSHPPTLSPTSAATATVRPAPYRLAW